MPRMGWFKAWAERRRDDAQGGQVGSASRKVRAGAMAFEEGKRQTAPPSYGRQQGHKNSKCHFYALSLLEVSLGICDNIRSAQ